MLSSESEPQIKALVVCLGNICRSPMGEAVLKDIATKRGVQVHVDSCGTAGYHVGEEPDERYNNVSIDSLARQISTSDFVRFTHILAADENNLRHLESMKPHNATAEVRLWGSYHDNKAIPDPYYGGMNGFEKVFQQCIRLSHAFLDEVVGKAEAKEV
ncbi:low molecular weight phosphotyrosine protein phosphatase [Pholiota conissans]|uniref:Low molecular weight phosphotyrosine protein phosphatase n=1 Tax=Pholiota conissans TaxID=109636 RepID=A0A9P5Z1M6_9AGAR|nr:low molecular weight phosphotyrosine protein phosphatase [Pholiota conissans]